MLASVEKSEQVPLQRSVPGSTGAGKALDVSPGAEELGDQVPVLCRGAAAWAGLLPGAVQAQLLAPSFVSCWVSSCLLVLPARSTPVPLMPKSSGL